MTRTVIVPNERRGIYGEHCEHWLHEKRFNGGIAKWEGRGLQNRYERVRFPNPLSMRVSGQVRAKFFLSTVSPSFPRSPMTC